MADPIDFDEALADPPDLTLEPPVLVDPPIIKEVLPKRDIPNQLLSAARAWELRDEFASGRRDPNNRINVTEFALPASLQRRPNSEQLDAEIRESNETRDLLGVERINEGVFRQFRDPSNSRETIVQFLIAMGLEVQFEEDLRVL
jgi:hypothetical protein